MKYEILTNVRASECTEDEEVMALLTEEQWFWLKANMGIDVDNYNETHTIEFSNGRMAIIPVYDAIMMLPLKDGADLVRFDDGNVGFVSVYGQAVEWFKILS